MKKPKPPNDGNMTTWSQPEEATWKFPETKLDGPTFNFSEETSRIMWTGPLVSTPRSSTKRALFMYTTSLSRERSLKEQRVYVKIGFFNVDLHRSSLVANF